MTGTVRVIEMREMRAAGHTLRQIGSHFKITSERVRQVLEDVTIDRTCDVCDSPYNTRTAATRACSARCARLLKSYSLSAARARYKDIVRTDQLRAAGMRWCSRCKSWKPVGDFIGVRTKRLNANCRTCNADQIRRYVYEQKKRACF